MAAPSATPHRRPLSGVLIAIVLALTGLVLTGCSIELALDTSVETDGSGSIGIRMAADKEFQDLIAQQGADGDMFAEFEQQMPGGWETETGIDPDGTRWVTAMTSFADLDEFQALLQGGEGGLAEAFSGQQITLTQDGGLFTTKTNFSAEWDAGSALSSAGDELPEGVDMSMLSSIFQIQNRLTLPGSIGENNADEIDGNTLVWMPSMAGITSMSAESTAYNWGLIIGIIVAAMVVLLVVIVVLILLLRRQKAPAAPPAALAGAPAEMGGAAPDVMPSTGGQPAPSAEQVPVPPGETLWAQVPAEAATTEVMPVTAPPLETPSVEAPPVEASPAVAPPPAEAGAEPSGLDGEVTPDTATDPGSERS